MHFSLWFLSAPLQPWRNGFPFGAAAFQPKALTGVARIQGIAVRQIDDLTARSASYTTDKIWQNCKEIIEHLMIQNVFLGYPIEYHHHEIMIMMMMMIIIIIIVIVIDIVILVIIASMPQHCQS